MLLLPLSLQSETIDDILENLRIIKTPNTSIVTLVIYHKEEKIASATYNSQTAYLDDLSVMPQHQNKGYGSFLFKTVCTDLAKNGHKQMKWYAMSPGFKQQSRLNQFYASHEGVVEQKCINGSQNMSLDLSPYSEALL